MVGVTLKMLANWLLLVETVLAFDISRRIQLWAKTRDAGIAALQNIGVQLHSIRSNEDDCLTGTAKAYALIREVVKICKPTTQNGSAAMNALPRKWRDVTVCQCARVVGISDQTNFLRELDDAFGGLLLGSRDLSSQMLNSYTKILADYEGSFLSNSARLAERRGWVRPRAPRGSRASAVALADDTAAASSSVDDTAAASSSVSVDAATQTGGAECSIEGGVCHLVVAPNATAWYAPPGLTTARVPTLQCRFGHTIQREQYMRYPWWRYWLCPMCNYPLYVLQ